MDSRRPIVLRPLLLIALLGSVAQGSPIAYNFAAKLEQPIDGSDQVRGTFTLEDAYPSNSNNSTVLIDPGSSKYPLQLNFAGHSISLDGLTMPFSEGYFQFAQGDLINLGGNVAAGQNSFGSQLYFALEFTNIKGAYGYWDAKDLSGQQPPLRLPTLDSRDWTGKFAFSVQAPGGGPYTTGVITSIERSPSQPASPAPVPEPSTLAVLILAGATRLARRRRASR